MQQCKKKKKNTTLQPQQPSLAEQVSVRKSFCWCSLIPLRSCGWSGGVKWSKPSTLRPIASWIPCTSSCTTSEFQHSSNSFRAILQTQDTTQHPHGTHLCSLGIKGGYVDSVWKANAEEMEILGEIKVDNGYGMHGYPAILLVGYWFWGIIPFHLAIRRNTDHRWCWSQHIAAVQQSKTSNRPVVIPVSFTTRLHGDCRISGCELWLAIHCGNPHHWTNRISMHNSKAASITSHCTLDQVPSALSSNMALQPPLEIGKGQGVLKCGHDTDKPGSKASEKCCIASTTSSTKNMRRDWVFGLEVHYMFCLSWFVHVFSACVILAPCTRPTLYRTYSLSLCLVIWFGKNGQSHAKNIS